MKKLLTKIILPVFLVFGVILTACDNLPDSLSMPQNLKIENRILAWDEVEYADGYSIEINNAEYETTDCYYELTGLDESKIHKIGVTAISKAGIESSATATITYNGQYALPTSGLEFLKNSRNAYMVSKFAATSDGTCVVPATYQGLPVTGFDFDDTSKSVRSQIKKLYLPNCILDTYLKGETFGVLPNLEYIEMETGNKTFVGESGCLVNKKTKTLIIGTIGGDIPDSVTKIGEYAFYNRNVTEIALPESVIEIGQYAFADCTAMTKINFSSNLETIGWGAFMSCTSLEAVTLPDSVSLLSAYVFTGCTSLKSVKLSEKITWIDGGIFWDCKELSRIEMPNIERLGNVFKSCISLKLIVLPQSLTEVGSGVFRECPLEEVYYMGTESEWTEKVTVSTSGNDSFLSATRYYYSETAPTEAGSFWHYVDGVPAKWE